MDVRTARIRKFSMRPRPRICAVAPENVKGRTNFTASPPVRLVTEPASTHALQICSYRSATLLHENVAFDSAVMVSPNPGQPGPASPTTDGLGDESWVSRKLIHIDGPKGEGYYEVRVAASHNPISNSNILRQRFQCYPATATTSPGHARHDLRGIKLANSLHLPRKPAHR